ncbi:MAG TPA: Fe-S cluster assembly protein SufB [Acidimicrobiales bacterium]|nr:Fe-S cluster assembly protein SufB [Acidimicrobiales bacterium]
MTHTELDLGRYKLGWSDVEDYVFKPKKGLSEDIVREMSEMKGEPKWMRDFRLRALKKFFAKPMAPWFAVNMPDLDFDDIYYYVKPMQGQVNDWEELPDAIKNTYEKLGIPEAERKYLAGVTSQYECLVGSTRVWTTSGMRLIKELGAGDEVFSLDEDTKQIVCARVLSQRCSGEKEVFEISARGRRIAASANHPFLVLRDDRREGRQRARFRATWVPAEQLREGDLVAIATDVPDFGAPAELLLPDRPDASGLPVRTSDEFCWWAGVYLGDGYLKHSGGYVTVEIAVDRTDEVLVAEIRRVMHDLFGLDMRLARDGFRLVGRGTAALAEFLELNGLGGKSLTKRLPDWSFGLPRSERLALIAGLLDSDGYVRDHPTSKDAAFCSANSELLGQLKELLALCGIGSSSVISVSNRHPFDRDRIMQAYHLRLSGRFDQIPARSPRRRDRLGRRKYPHTYRTAKGTVFRAHTSEMLGFVRVDSIEPVGVESVYDIEVTGHHNFVAEGFVVHNSEVVYHRNREDLEAQGVLFCDMDTAVREYPDLVRKWFATIIPPNDNKFAALNSAVWSGGSFIYVPPGVSVDAPLQAYFRINAENMGQFERTLIIADEGAQVHYVEGCSAPVYSTDSLHSAVVELVALPGSRITYTTIQNWSNNVYNLVTKRARAEAEAHVEWIDGNIGSRLTMKYPSVYLVGPKASGEVLSVAYAGPGQHQDAGAKMIHAAPETSSTIVSKSISKDGGVSTYRGLVRVDEGAKHSKSFVRCDALILDEESTSETKPYMEVAERDAQIGHEATVSKIGEDQLFYLMSRGLSESQAMGMIVNGFIEPITRTLPMEYAVEWSRLIELQMEGSVG